MANVSVHGIVQDSQGKPLSNIKLEILGTHFITTTDKNGNYGIDFMTISPVVLRIRASSESTMIGIKRLDIIDESLAVEKLQKFETNFTLVTPYTTAFIDTKKRAITGDGTSQNQEGYIITTPYTKYQIPFDAIVQGRSTYHGKLKAMVFEFDRKSSSYLLNADVFDGVE